LLSSLGSVGDTSSQSSVVSDLAPDGDVVLAAVSGEFVHTPESSSGHSSCLLCSSESSGSSCSSDLSDLSTQSSDGLCLSSQSSDLSGDSLL